MNKEVEMTKVQQMFTIKQLNEMQSWDLNKKIAVTKTRIAEFYNKFYDKTNILLFRMFATIQKNKTKLFSTSR